MKQCIILFIIVGLSVESIAQVPGYIGKRFSISVGANFAPRLTVRPIIGVTPGFTGGIDYVLSRKTAAYATFDYSIQPFRMNTLTVVDKLVNNYNGTYDYLSIRPKNYSPLTNQGTQKAKIVQFSAGFKFYRNKYVSPVGRYIKLGLTFCQYGNINGAKGMEVDYAEENYNSTSWSYRTGYIVPKNIKTNAIAINIGVGKGIALSSKLLMDLYLESNLFVGPDRGVFRTTYKPENTIFDPNPDKFINDLFWSDMRYRELFQFGFSLRYMIS